jgi:hypothetical protein
MKATRVFPPDEMFLGLAVGSTALLVEICLLALLADWQPRLISPQPKSVMARGKGGWSGSSHVETSESGGSRIIFAMDWPDYLRDQAAMYRQLAEQADDPAIKNEMLELASVCEDLANWQAGKKTDPLPQIALASLIAPPGTCFHVLQSWLWFASPRRFQKKQSWSAA